MIQRNAPKRWWGRFAIIVMVTAFVGATQIFAQDNVDGAVIPPRAPASIRYGTKPAQVLKYWRPLRNVASPLLVVIDEGGWSQSRTASSYFLAAYLANRGFAVALLPNYRHMEPRVQSIAADATQAVVTLIQQDERRSIQPDKLGILGIGTGAAPAALLATDPVWVQKIGVPFDALKIFVSIDGDGLVVDRTSEALDSRQKKAFDLAFGTTSAVRRNSMALSHVEAPNVPQALLLTTALERRRVADAGYFAQILTEHGTHAQTYVMSAGEADRLRSSLSQMDGVAMNMMVDRLTQALKGGF